jgi:hypothetical protein
MNLDLAPLHGQDFSDLWVPKLVKNRLVESVKIINATTGRVGPQGFGPSLPRFILDAAGRREGDGETPWWGWVEEGRPRRRFDPVRVTQAEAEALWPWTYLKDVEPPRDSNLDLLTTLQMWIFCKVDRRITFEEACEVSGWSRGTAYRAVDRGASVIAQCLNRDGVPVPANA